MGPWTRTGSNKLMAVGLLLTAAVAVQGQSTTITCAIAPARSSGAPTWGPDPGPWMLALDDGTGEVLVREVEFAPGPPNDVVLP